MQNLFDGLLEDVDLGIRSKVTDLKSSLTCLMSRGEALHLDLSRGGTNGPLEHLAEVQGRGILVARLCEELLTLLTVRKRIQVHAAAAKLQTGQEKVSGVEAPDAV